MDRIVIAHAVKVALLVTVLGLAWRGRGRRCWAMWAYLWFALVGNTLTTTWPDVFFNMDFWARRQIAFDVLKLLVAGEVAFRALGAFPGAQASWRTSVLAGLSLAALLFLLLPHESAKGMLFVGQPQLVILTVWLFTMTALVVVFYRIPIDPWHRSILLGFGAYQLVFTAAVGLGQQMGMPTFPWLQRLDSLAYLGLVCAWAWAAWRHEEELVVSPEVRRALRLEASA